MSVQFWTSAVVVLAVVHILLGAVAYSVFLERKIASWVQDRIGPNRVGPRGLLQPLADGIKLLTKEDFTPAGVDNGLFSLAPLLGVVPAMLGWAIIPWGGYYDFPGLTIWSWVPFIGGATLDATVVNITAAPISIGIIYPLAIGSLAVYGVVLAGYASNNKYSFLGGLRATAQMLSYEIPMGLGILIVLLMTGSLRADYIVDAQANHVWFIFYQPLLAAIFFTCILAECNRTPFDLAECETELVGGFHTEYSSMRFSLFFLGEYMHMVAGCAFFTLLFLGGWDFPFFQPMVGGLGLVLFKFAVFAGKIFLLMSLMMMIRWTLPRFRFDQLMKLAWRGLIPMAIVLLLTTGLAVATRQSPWINLAANGLLFVVAAWWGNRIIPQGPPVNRKVPLAGSRFSPAR